MDEPLTGGSLCSGSGGLDLGLSLALAIDWRWHCEKDDAASRILAEHHPSLPNYGDLFETDWSVVERVDLVAAGFPCPDYSLAGKRVGIDGEHGQVWIAVAAALRALRPRYVVLENVDAIRSAPGPLDGAPGESAVGTVLADLADLGYRWAYDRIRAADVGAPHGRLRWFCVAALPSTPDAVGAGVDADRRLPRRGPGAHRPGGSAPSADADPERVAREEAGELDGGPGEGEEPGASGEEGETERRASGRAGGGGDHPTRLLPTPTAGDGKSSGSRNLEGSKAHAGVSLTDAVQMGGSTTPRLLPTPTGNESGVKSEKAQRPRGEGGMGSPPGLGETVRLLPTPQAADGDGGRQEKGAMGNSGVRPSGHKATLPLPTAVAMRDELTETPFAQPVEEGQLVLLPTPTCYVGDRVEGQLPTEVAMLPTPVANPENPGAGGELRAALTHGPGRRNETGIDSLGRPNQGRTRMLPTPTAEDGERGRAGAGSDRLGAATFDDSLLPTPPTSRDGKGPNPNAREGGDDLPTAALRTEVAWGVYEGAVRRWEDVLGRDAPAPTDEKGRLDPPFVEWMLGYPDGWFDVEGVSRTRKLRALGNSVQVQCGEAVGGWLAFLVESGLLD